MSGRDAGEDGQAADGFGAGADLCGGRWLQEPPVHDRLVTERGDVPALVRGEADRLHRELAQLLRQARRARAVL
ncbi:hypothetical protein ACH4TQ_49620 [Streptomyces sp. NPDC021218]|uniref:hypothetical protein n=1 Tax=Streptomyces sp. NPDC021218 TaxID=3365119 RepID=UPI0037A9DF2D